MNSKKLATVLIGLAWPLFGLGFMSVYFGYLPTGVDLIAEIIGLFVAGILSALLYLTVRAGFKRPFERGMINAGYFLFAPIGVMIALLAPGPFEAANGLSSITFVIGAPLAIALYSNTAIAAGLGITGGLVKSAHTISNRVHGHSPQLAKPIRIRS